MERELSEIVADVCASVFRSQVDLADAPPERGPHGGLPTAEPTMSSWVLITGAWEGAVVLRCTRSWAARVAGAMFDATDPSAEDTADALGEIVNMVGGNVKALLPGPSRLSLPMVAEGAGGPVGGRGRGVVGRLAVESQGEPLVVSVLRTDADAPRPRGAFRSSLEATIGAA